LYRGRVLFLQHKLVGEQGASDYLQMARIPDQTIGEMMSQQVAEFYAMRGMSLPLIEGPPDQPPQIDLNRVDPATVRAILRALVPFRRAKHDATYWLGLISIERGHYEEAVRWLRDRTLELPGESLWQHGAIYNIARAYEASGLFEEAILRYESDPRSPAHHGNLLRAKWLKACWQEKENGDAGTIEPVPAGETPLPPKRVPAPPVKQPKPPDSKPGVTRVESGTNRSSSDDVRLPAEATALGEG
jgi:hypothetical protein